MLNRFAPVNWYYIDRGQKAGPLADEQLDELVRKGQLTPDALIWREGMAEWQPYGSVRSLTGPGAPERASGRVLCALCSKSFAPDDVIAFENAWVCAVCKPRLVQRVREGLTVGRGSGNAWRDGDLVVTIPGSTLTGRCVRCNGTESLSHTSSSLHWHPRWVYLLLLLTPVAYLVGVLATQKIAWVAVSVCQHHRNRRSTLLAASWLFPLGGLGVGAAAAYLSSVLLVGVAGGLLAYGAFVFRRQWIPLSVAKIEEDYVWLRGCGREFADALPEWNQRTSAESQNRGSGKQENGKMGT